MTLLIIAIVCRVLILAVLYGCPLPGKSFKKLYAAVDERQRSRLPSFHLENELKVIHVNAAEWTYLSAGTGDRTLVFQSAMGGM